MIGEKRSEMIFFLNSVGVRITSRQSSSSTGSQSVNQVLIAVGVSCEERIRLISFQMSISEFTDVSPFQTGDEKSSKSSLFLIHYKPIYYNRFCTNMQ